MRYLTVLATLFLLALSARAEETSKPAPPLPYDHYAPLLLNEAAVASAAADDLATAWVLLERAARLAPHDPRIADNLATVRAYRVGSPSRETQVPAPVDDATEQAYSRAPSPLPPLWPRR